MVEIAHDISAVPFWVRLRVIIALALLAWAFVVLLTIVAVKAL